MIDLVMGMATREREGSSLKVTTTARAGGAVAGNVGGKREREEEVSEEEYVGSDELRKESIVVVSINVQWRFAFFKSYSPTH